jgi:dynactin complex subunit
LRDAIGKHAGTVAGNKYFECKKNHGLLVSLNKIMFITMLPMNPMMMQQQQQMLMQKAAAGGKPKGKKKAAAKGVPFRKEPIYESFPDIVPGTKITKKKKTKAAWCVPAPRHTGE